MLLSFGDIGKTHEKMSKNLSINIRFVQIHKPLASLALCRSNKIRLKKLLIFS